RAGHPDQRACVCRSTDHVESAVLEDVHDPFPDKGLVLSDQDANRLWRTHGTKLCCEPRGHHPAPSCVRSRACCLASRRWRDLWSTERYSTGMPRTVSPGV